MVNVEKLKYLLSKAQEEKDAIRPIYNRVLELTDSFAVIKDEGRQVLSGSSRDVDSDILDAISALTSFIMSSILPKTARWADLEIDELKMFEMFGDSAQRDIDQINSVLQSDIDRTFNFIQNSNYYEEVSKAMKMFVRVGTGCFSIRETGVPSKPFLYEYVGLDNLFLLNDNFSRPNIVFKKHPEVNAEYLKDVFGVNIKIPSSLDESKLDSNITVYECVIPEYDETTTLTTYNYIIITEDLSEVLLEKELEYNPFIIFKWDNIESNSWGSSAILDQVSLLEELQQYQELYKTQARRIANPAGVFYGNQELFNSLSMEEGTLNYGKRVSAVIKFR